MKRGVYVRLLVPRRDATGKIHYETELHLVRVPVRREDRLAFLDRLSSRPPEPA